MHSAGSWKKKKNNNKDKKAFKLWRKPSCLTGIACFKEQASALNKSNASPPTQWDNYALQ